MLPDVNNTMAGSSGPAAAGPAIALLILGGCMFVATRFGLVALIANGYRALAAIILLVFVVPVLTIGTWKLWRGSAAEVKP